MHREKIKTFYIGGTFDLFHYGHVRLFANARGLCDRLVVAVNSDDFALQYKKMKPVMSQSERLEVIRACRYVDSCFIMKKYEDQIKHISIHNVSGIVHGSDWTGDSLVKQLGIDRRFLKLNQIEMIYLPYTETISTTEIKKRLKNA